jgi:hypothetical protein
MSNMIVAETILHQLGGPRFRAMTGARHLVGDDKGLRFALPSRFARNGINRVSISLEPSDTYHMTCFRVRGTQVTIMDSVHDVYADQLQYAFTRSTGLETSLGTMGRTRCSRCGAYNAIVNACRCDPANLPTAARITA